MAPLILVVWIAAALVGGAGVPESAVFPDKPSCMEAVARVESLMVEDGDGDGDLISGCVEVTLRAPAK